MRTGRSLTVCHSLLLGGTWIWSPFNFPLGCGPGSDPPPFPPWVWAWIWSPSISPLGVGLDLIPLNFPLGCGPGPDPPQFPPWVWAWTWSPSISPLGVGLDLIPLHFSLGCGPGPECMLGYTPPPPLETCCKACWDTSCNACWDTHPPTGDLLQGMLGYLLQCMLGYTPPPVNRITHACKNITLAQLRCGR